jgi:protein-tyrosine-phosphatase/predicted ATP-grasp superfamily ATP-dependent carboligase
LVNCSHKKTAKIRPIGVVGRWHRKSLMQTTGGMSSKPNPVSVCFCVFLPQDRDEKCTDTPCRNPDNVPTGGVVAAVHHSMKPQQKVLILGDDTRSFLACVRSLGRAGIEVHVAPENWGSPALQSRYIHKKHRLPTHIGDGSVWLQAMIALLQAEKFSLVIPTAEPALLPLYSHRDQLLPHARLAIPDEQSLAVLFNKIATRALAASVGVPTAKGLVLGPEVNADTAIATLGLPMVFKPAHSYQLNNLSYRREVEVIESAEHLQAVLTHTHEEPALLEAYFAGAGVGVSVLASRGRVLQHFQHVRHHERGAGATGYRMSAAPDSALTAACERLVDALQYTGLAMFEFKRNAASGEWILLEVNARPWGSLPLPVSLGIDFPLWWFRLLVDGEEIASRAYQPQRYQRNFEQDAWYQLAELRKSRRSVVSLARFAFRSSRELGRFLIGTENNDTLVRDDPAPGIAELKLLVRHARERLMGRKARDPRVRLQQLASRPGLHIEFVCKGNICRSPYAAGLLASAAAAHADASVTVGSSGTFAVEGRTSPVEAITTAAIRTGTDLASHRSHFLSEERIASADLVIVFDAENEAAVLSRYPEASDKTFLLTEFEDGVVRGRAIDDPYSGGLHAFEQSYLMIEEGVRALSMYLNLL